MSLQQEDDICAEGRTAPRVSLQDIESSIAAVHYRSGAECIGHTNASILRILTVCFVIMENGFIVIGKAAPASPDNYDAKLGEKLAYEDAVRQIWPLMGFELRQRLFSAAARKAKWEYPDKGA